MDNMQIGQEKSRKKFLIPLIVLMLCAVSLTGAAYAYSSSLTNTGNSTDTEYLSLDKDSSKQKLVELSGNTVMGFTDNYTYNGEVKTENVIKYEYATGSIIIAKYNLKIDNNGDAKNVKLSVSSSNLNEMVLYGTTKLTSVYDVTYKIGDTSYKVGLAGTPAVTGEEATVFTQSSLEVTIVFTLKEAYAENHSGTVETIDYTVDNPSTNTAKTYYEAFKANTNNVFALNFTATTIST